MLSISKDSKKKKLSDSGKNFAYLIYHNALTALGRRIFTYEKLIGLSSEQKEMK